jgi:hypothetical protein
MGGNYNGDGLSTIARGGDVNGRADCTLLEACNQFNFQLLVAAAWHHMSTLEIQNSSNQEEYDELM